MPAEVQRHPLRKVGILVALALLTPAWLGCNTLSQWFGQPNATPAPAPASDGGFDSQNATEIKLAPAKAPRGAALPNDDSDRAEIVLRIMLVQIPQTQRSAAEKIWNHLKEDVLDADSMTRIRRNGMRIGVGRLEFWEPIQAALAAIEGTRSNPWEPLRIPPAYVLGLELDTTPHDQTIFCVQDDGILSGGTFTDSRNMLQMSCLLDPRERKRVHLLLVPEVRQQTSEMQWVRTEHGVMEVPKQSGQRFNAAALRVALDPGQFVLVAPSDQSRLFGILGGAMLTEEVQNQRYDSYVFLRPEVVYAAGS